VLAPDVDTDYSLRAKIAAALLGGFCATPEDFEHADGSPRGIMYTEQHRNPKHSFHVAVSAALANALPTLPNLLRAIAHAPGSCFTFFPVRTHVVQVVFQKEREDNTADSAEDLRSL